MSARSGMAEIISQVRQLSAAGTADYTVGTASYWSDDQLQTILDRTRLEIWHEPINYVLQYGTAGTVTYTEYRVPWTWLEQTTGGTTIFYLQDSTYAVIGTANYTVDYAYGRVTFGADQHGSARYVTGRSYDVYEAAAVVWEQKAGFEANKFDFDADGLNVKKSQVYAHCMAMARQLRSQGRSAVTHSKLVRDDVNNCDDYPGRVKATRVTF